VGRGGGYECRSSATRRGLHEKDRASSEALIRIIGQLEPIRFRNGAPFDAFFSADEEYPQQLITEGLAAKDTLLSLCRRGGWCCGCRRDSPLGLIKARYESFCSTLR